MRRGGEHKKFEKYQSFCHFEDQLVDCGVFSEEWKTKMLAIVEQCMKHAYSRGFEQAQIECENKHGKDD